MKKLTYILMSAILLCGCVHKTITKNNKVKMIVASDIHYFLKDYYQECSWFEESLLYEDGKMVTYANEIIDEFIDVVKKEKPDIVVLTGDLSFNGEKGSHQGLADKLMKIKDAGITVAVIPGNHDVDNIFTKGYGKDDYLKVEATTAKEFSKIYAKLGYDQAITKHEKSLSYRLDLNKQYSLLMVDSNSHELTTGTKLDTGGQITKETYAWIEEQLKDINEANQIPIIAMHHNLVNHNSLLNNGYTVKDSEHLVELFSQYHVPFVLSGHIHCQNIKEINGLYDIASSSLLDTPLQYGIIEIDQASMQYHTQSLKISVSSDDYFDQVSRNRFEEEVGSKDILDLLVKANRYYFTGNISEHIDELKAMKGYRLLMNSDNKKMKFHQQYLNSLLEEKKTSQKFSIKF